MIDFHCHLDLYPNPREVAKECADRSLYVLSVTTTPSAWEGTSALLTDVSRIRVALGLHPELAHDCKAELDLFDKLLLKTPYVGEIGLDGTPERRPFWDYQTYVFERILSACSSAGGRIMSIHSRRAAAAVLDYLEKYEGAGTPVLHWYSGGSRDLARAIDMGCWFSVGPAMLANEKGRKLVSRMPRDRLLTETDGPFARVDGRKALPWDVEIAENALADLWHTDRSDVQSTLGENLRRLAIRASTQSHD